MNPLEELRSLVHARRLLDREIAQATVNAIQGGSNRWSVAAALGVSRATLYRRFAWAMEGER